MFIIYFKTIKQIVNILIEVPMIVVVIQLKT